MFKRLPIPIFNNGCIYTEIDFEKPKTGTIIKAEDAINNSSTYRAMLEIIKGSVTGLKDDSGNILDDKRRIGEILRLISYKSAEWLSIQIVLMISKDDGVEGLYKCPLCEKKIICKRDRESGIDNRDHVSDLKCLYDEDQKGNIFIELTEQVEIKGRKPQTGEEVVLYQVSSIALRHPTLFDCENAVKKYSMSNKSKLQLGILKEALTEINGEPVQEKFKNMYGMKIFQEMDLDDINLIGKQSAEFGLDNTVQKICPDCGNEWRAELNTSNFFVSGLRQN